MSNEISYDNPFMERVNKLLSNMEKRYQLILYRPGFSSETASLLFDIKHIKNALTTDSYTGNISRANMNYLKSELDRLGPRYLD